MTVVPAGSLILVTGATGYVGFYVVQELLDRGFSVRVTARSPSKGDALIKHPTFKKAGDRLKYVMVPDIQADGAFDATLEGVSGIVHVASPLPGSVKTSIQDDILDPAINGTVGILKSAIKYPEIKRVVITSSFAAVSNSDAKPGSLFNEKVWNTASPREIEEKGDKAGPLIGYSASKALAEQAAWKFMEEKKPHFDLVTILPTLVCGPFSGLVSSQTELDYGNTLIYKYLAGSPDFTPESAQQGPPYPLVHVRDIAYAHAESLVLPAAGNQRINVSEGLHFWQEMLDVLHDKHPEIVSSFPNANWGVHGAKGTELRYESDNSVSKEILGLKYRNIEEIGVDAAKSALELLKTAN